MKIKPKIVIGTIYEPSLKNLESISKSSSHIHFDKTLNLNSFDEIEVKKFEEKANLDENKINPDKEIYKAEVFSCLLPLVKIAEKNKELLKSLCNTKNILNMEPRNMKLDPLENLFFISEEKTPICAEFFSLRRKVAELSLLCSRIELSLELDSVVTALSFESNCQATNFISSKISAKSSEIIKSEKIISNLLKNSRLSNKDTKKDNATLQNSPTLNSMVKTEFEKFKYDVLAALSDKVNLCSIRMSILLKSLNLKHKNIMEHVKLLLKNSSERLEFFKKITTKPVCNLKGTNEVEKLIIALCAEANDYLEDLKNKKDLKYKKVLEAQREKIEKQRNKMSKKDFEKASVKREEIILKKSNLGLGEGTRQFFEKFQMLSCPEKLFEMLSSDDGRAFLSNLVSKAVTDFKVSLPKGTRDYTPQMVAVRDEAISKITSVFQRYGAVGIDTPVFEKKEILTGKYGEDSKLIYDLEDQGGEDLSLRYDLTVPFARYIAVNKIEQIKRYHIGKVYRRDNPAVTKGKFREFYQCDFDIAGKYDLMVADAETIAICSDLLNSLELGDFVVRVNHRGILDAIMENCGVPSSKFRTICSAIDKLDKVPWENVRNEMVLEKGISEESADKIASFIFTKDSPKLILEKISEKLPSNKSIKSILQEMKTLFAYLEAHGCAGNVCFDLSLARGLDYYTGVIFEASLKKTGTESVSIAGGGRYDDLVGLFSSRKVPAVGVSIGIERILALMPSPKKGKKSKRQQNEVFVAAARKGLSEEKIKVCAFLRNKGIFTEMAMNDKMDSNKQIGFALEKGYEFMVFVSERINEQKRGNETLQLKNLIKETSEYLNLKEITTRVLSARSEQIVDHSKS